MSDAERESSNETVAADMFEMTAEPFDQMYADQIALTARVRLPESAVRRLEELAARQSRHIALLEEQLAVVRERLPDEAHSD